MSDFDDIVSDTSLGVLTIDRNRLSHPSLPGTLILSDEQQLAIEKMTSWATSQSRVRNQFLFGGFAGTGKTTVIKTLLRELRLTHNVAVCAFTGKACNVLMRKGIPASTLHSLMYDVIENEDGTIDFHIKPFLAGEPSLIIVDEASMVSTQLYNDLMRFGKPVVFVGDPGQLEPVGDNPNLMKSPDFTLTKIHRQAEASPILSLATAIRQGRPLQAVVEGPELIIKDKKISSSEVLAATQAICAKNKTRTFLNTSIRQYKTLPPATIVPGEKLICLRNNTLWGVFNGMLSPVTSPKVLSGNTSGSTKNGCRYRCGT